MEMYKLKGAQVKTKSKSLSPHHWHWRSRYWADSPGPSSAQACSHYPPGSGSPWGRGLEPARYQWSSPACCHQCWEEHNRKPVSQYSYANNYTSHWPLMSMCLAEAFSTEKVQTKRTCQTTNKAYGPAAGHDYKRWPTHHISGEK